MARGDGRRIGGLKNYDIWKDLPSEQLRDIGRRYFDNNNIDSALVCYAILANRYYTTPKSDKEELKWIGSAMNELGIIYTYFFVDYEKANRYLLQAKKIAEQNGNKKLRAATYVNLRNIRIVNDTFLGDGTISDSTINLHHYAFEASLDANDPESVLISAAGLAHMTASSPKRKVMLDDIKQFLNYKLPDSIKKCECVYDYCKAAMELSRGNKEAALSLYDQALSHVYYKEERNQEILTINILEDKCRLLLELNRYQIFSSGDVLWVNGTEDASKYLKEEKLTEHVTRLLVPVKNGHTDIETVLRYLGTLKIRRVMVEAGQKLTSAFINENFCDEIYAFISGKMLGSDGQNAFSIENALSLDNCRQFYLHKCRKIGSDVLLHYTSVQY